MQTVITLLEAAAPDLLDRCLAVRQEVFTREMGVPAAVERDSRDCLDGECRHFLITRDGRDIGAVRCPPQEDGTLRLQRFCIARALGPQTRYLLCDEITAMLDLITQAQIWQFLMEEAQRRELGLLVVSHNSTLLERICSRIVTLPPLRAP